ncbi:MAG TPA: hypothetical protein VMW34_08445 [Anaerolineales bacterium]|jgi:hypothetical protein|nr:hypothetical protein [Anaerolineales bacterium]
MIFDFLALPVVILASITAAVLLVSWDWRISMVSLTVQYACVFVLVSFSWPLETAAVKLVAGWMACAVLGLALKNLPKEITRQKPIALSDIIFRLIAAILAGLFAYTGGSKVVEWFPVISIEQAYGALILITLGLIHLGLTMQSLRVVMGLLTVLSGFGIIYAAVESSILVTGLLTIITLGLSIVGAYLLTAPTLEEAS